MAHKRDPRYGKIIRSELDDSMRLENKRASNRLGSEYRQLDRAQKVLTDDIAKQRHVLEITMNKSLTPRSPSKTRGISGVDASRTLLTSGLGYDLVTSSTTNAPDRYGSSQRPRGGAAVPHPLHPKKAPANRIPNNNNTKYARGFVPGSRRTSLPMDPEDLEKMKSSRSSVTPNKDKEMTTPRDRKPLWAPKHSAVSVKDYREKLADQFEGDKQKPVKQGITPRNKKVNGAVVT